MFDVRDPLESVSLVTETYGLSSCRLNGRSLDGVLSPIRLWGPNNAAACVSPYLKIGRNELVLELDIPDPSIAYLPPYAFLRGDFSVESGALCASSDLPSVSDHMFGDLCSRYTVTLGERDAEDAVALVADGYDACSLRINGREIGTCLRTPFRFDVAGALRAGENVIELTETRNLQNFFATPDRRIPVGLRGEPVLLFRAENKG